MTNLTSYLINKNASYSVEETVKSSNRLKFEGSQEQIVSRYSIPSVSVIVNYKGLTQSEFFVLRGNYEANNSNTFICDFNEEFDKRLDIMDINSSVWLFKDFMFTLLPSGLFDGQITLYTSVFFNYAKYQSLFSESSTYSISTTLDTSFRDLLDLVPPRTITYAYENDSFSNMIGVSGQLSKNKNGLRRKYRFGFLLNATSFNSLLMFYRKKSGMMGEFGCSDYEVNDGDMLNCRFVKDSMQYIKRLDGLYECELEVIEVKQ